MIIISKIIIILHLAYQKILNPLIQHFQFIKKQKLKYFIIKF